MPSYLQGDKRNVLTFVKVLKSLYYGWNAKDIAEGKGIGADDLVALGHINATAMAAVTSGIAVIGANRPKPGRATKVINENPDKSQQGKVSTFYGEGSENTTIAAGWKLTGYKEVANIRQTGRSKTVGIKLTGGGVYVFPMNDADVSLYGADLGLILPAGLKSAERDKMFSGATRPRPPRVQKDLGDNKKFASFCDPTKIDSLLDKGWSQTDPEILFPLGVVAPDSTP